MGRVTLQTIADKVGVSRMTVSNAFSRPDQLSAALRDRILTTAEELGYSGPDAAARALVRGRSGIVGILLTDSPYDAFADEVTTGLLAAITRELAPRGLSLALLAPSADDQANPVRDLAMDGAIVYSCTHGSATIEALARRGLPTVFVDQPPIGSASMVGIDDEDGARQAAAHLVSLGHNRVAVVTDGLTTTGVIADDPLEHAANDVARARLTGWLGPLHDAGIDPTAVGLHEHDGDHRRRALTDLLTARPSPTALLCISDAIALEVIGVAHELGIDVPGGLSVVGFDDAPAALRSTPRLTTVRQDLDAKGLATAQSLTTAMAAVQSGGSVTGSVVTLPTELVVRESTAPPSHDG